MGGGAPYPSPRKKSLAAEVHFWDSTMEGCSDSLAVLALGPVEVLRQILPCSEVLSAGEHGDRAGEEEAGNWLKFLLTLKASLKLLCQKLGKPRGCCNFTWMLQQPSQELRLPKAELCPGTLLEAGCLGASWGKSKLYQLNPPWASHR